MSDLPAPPPRDPDELASALVDGLLPPEEAAQAERDPAIAERVARMERARAALRAVPPPDPATADEAVAAALAAFDTSDAPHALAAPHAGVDSGRARRGVLAPWLAAAAAVVVVLLAVGLLSQGNDGGEEDTASSEAPDEQSGAAESESGGAGDGGGEPGTASGSGAPNEGPDAQADVPEGAPSDAEVSDEGTAFVPHLGEVRDGHDLTSRVADARGSAPTAAGDAPASGDVAGTPPPDQTGQAEADRADCPGLTTTGDLTVGTSTYVADATLDGTPVRVHVYDTPTGPRIVATTPTCTELLNTPYTP